MVPDPAPQASDLTADQLIAKYAAARGGEQKLKSIRSTTMTGAWEPISGGSNPIVVMVAPGRYMRRIAHVMTNVVDGQTTWETNTLNGMTEPMPMSSKAVPRFRHSADPQGPLVDPKAKGNKIEVVGKQPWRGSQVYKLKVTLSDRAVSFFYLDAKSFLLVRSVSRMYVPQMDKTVDMEMTYRDFRDVDGVKWPFTEESNAPETGFKYTITWTAIDINKPLDESAFKMPKS